MAKDLYPGGAARAQPKPKEKNRSCQTTTPDPFSTVTALISDALREALAKRRHKRRNGRVTLPTYGKKGLHPGVDLDDTAALLDLMEPSNGPGRR